MSHVVQVILSGVPQIPKLFIDNATAESAYVACVKEYWARSYPAYCDRNGVSTESVASAQAFLKTFDFTDPVKIYYWALSPKDSDTATPYSSLSAPEPLKEEREPDSMEVVVTDETYDTPEWKNYVQSIKNMCGGTWGEFRLFTRQDWRQDVYSNATSFEYWEWVAAKIDIYIKKAKRAGYSVIDDPESPGHARFKAPDGVLSEISCDTPEEAWCRAALQCGG